MQTFYRYVTTFMTSSTVRFPHKPLLEGKQYSVWTEYAEQAVLNLPKSAILLWHRLLRDKPGGVEQMVELKELAKEFDYTFQSMKNAIARLVSQGLVEVLRDFGKGVIRLIAYHAGPVVPLDKKICETEKNLQNCKTNFESRKKICRSKAEVLDLPEVEFLQSNTKSSSAHTEESKCVQEDEIFSDPKPLKANGSIESHPPGDEMELIGRSPTAQHTGEDTMSEKILSEEFDQLWRRYCGTKLTKYKGNYRKAKSAFLSLIGNGWSGKDIFLLYEQDFAHRMKQAEASQDRFYESFPYLENYLQEGYLRSVKHRLEQSSCSALQNATPITPAYSWSDDDQAYYLALCKAGLVDYLPFHLLPVVSGKKHVRKKTKDNRFVLASLDEMRAEFNIDEIKLTLAFMRHAQKPSPEDRG